MTATAVPGSLGRVECYGWYRGLAITSPDEMNRIEVRVPSIAGRNSLGLAWPFDKRDVVEKGEGVWVMFEQGDTRRPIWGGRWVVNDGPWVVGVPT